MRHLNKTKFYSPANSNTPIPSEVVRETMIAFDKDDTDVPYDGFWLHQTKIHCDVCKKLDPMAAVSTHIKKDVEPRVYVLIDEMRVHENYWFYIPEYHTKCLSELKVKLVCPL